MRRIDVVEYDSNWPQQFETEAAVLARVFGEQKVRVHHIGSTAVPGVAAKPTIDILCEMRPGTVIRDYYEEMSKLGYECRGECLDAIIPGTPGRYYFPKVVNEQHVTHVHVCHEGHFQVPDILAFRNYLRAHPSDAREYGDLKARLAERHTFDNVAYMRGKDSMVKRLIEKARKWRERNAVHSVVRANQTLGHRAT